MNVTWDIKQPKHREDFISVNKSLLLSKRPSMWEVRAKQAEESRQKQQLQKTQRYMLQNVKWDIIRYRQQQKDNRSRQAEQFQTFKRTWAQRMQCFGLVVKMYSKFVDFKRQKIAKFNMNVLAMLIRVKQRGLVRRKVNRENNTVRHSLTLITVQRNDCLGYVHAFIEWKSMTKHLFVLIKRYCEQIRRIQRCWKRHKLSQQLRKQALSYFWPRVAIKYKVGLKISEDVKQKVIALFLHRQNLMHAARYLVWK